MINNKVMVNSRRNFIKSAGLMAAGTIAGYMTKGPMAGFEQDLPDLLTDEKGGAINSIPAWEAQRKVIKKRWDSYLGAIEYEHNPQAVKILNEEITDGVIRQSVEYENEPGIFVTAFILRPQAISKPAAGIVALHSTSDNQMLYIAGVKKGEIAALGFNLARKGFVVICPMCFLWQDRGGRSYEEQVRRFQIKHPGSKGMAKMLFDAQRAVDVLEGIKDVDRNRIGTVGHSLGGKEAFYLGAFDERVKVIGSNEGGIGIGFSNWDDPWYLGKEIHNFGHEHHELLGLCAPKPFLLIGGDFADGEKSRPYLDAVKPVYQLYGKPRNIELFNHGIGHNVTPEAEKRTYDWMLEHL